MQPQTIQNRLAAIRAALVTQNARAIFIRRTTDIAWATGIEGVFDAEAAHALYISAEQAVIHTDSRYEAALRRGAQAAHAGITVDATRETHAAFAARMLKKDTVRASASLADLADAERVRVQERLEEPLLFDEEISYVEYCRLCAALAPQDAAPARGAAAAQSAVHAAPAPASTPASAAPAPAPVPVQPEALRVSRDFVAALRAVKDADEVAALRAAQAITDDTFAHMIDFIKPGMTEKEIKQELDDYLLWAGADEPAFATIVAVGANAASPHHVPDETVLEKQSWVLLDFGAKKNGYCADMTRMVYCKDALMPIQNAYKTLHEVHEKLIPLIKPGVRPSELAQRCEELLAEAGFANAMGHGLGHGVGLDIHEAPAINARNDEPLVEGNVLTIEPGIYKPVGLTVQVNVPMSGVAQAAVVAPPFGVRLEDFGIVTADGFDVFTKSSHDIVII